MSAAPSGSSWPLAVEVLTLFMENAEAATARLVCMSHSDTACTALWLATIAEAAVESLAEMQGTDPAELVRDLALQLAREAG